uniref:Uncharacterized protein n=1 Tax=Candidatus Berkiella aquae TaxID=295108 RepID=A0A0Q9YLM6_9GAMM
MLSENQNEQKNFPSRLDLGILVLIALVYILGTFMEF